MLALTPCALLADSGNVQLNPQKAADSTRADSLGIVGFGNRVFDLGSIIVTATRDEESSFRLPVIAQSLGTRSVTMRQMSRTLPEALKEIPAVSVQKTSYGQGSPYIRGFTGYHTLLMVDGVRLNNSVFRSGPNQYAGTIDPLAISRIEVVKGPGSSLYGSDAVGGTVNVVTFAPVPHPSTGRIHSNLYYRYGSADLSNVGRVEFVGAVSPKIGLSGAYSSKNFGDLHPGDGPRLPRTGYDEESMNFGLDYQMSAGSRLEAAHQQFDQNNVWRTHRTIYSVDWLGTTHGDDKRLSTDQYRDLTYVRYTVTNERGALSRLCTQLSYQTQTEDQDRIKKDNTSEIQGFAVKTTGGSIQGETPSRCGTFIYGLDFYNDRVSSYRSRYRADGSLSSVDIQGPVADDSRYTQVEVFIEDQLDITQRWQAIPAVRFSATDAIAGRAANPSKTGDPVLTIKKHWNHVTGSLRTLVYLDDREEWNLFGSVGGAFRSPNLSDLSRFDIALSGEQEVPTPDLNPETFVAYEIGVKHLSTSVGAQFALYYTDIDNLIVRTPRGDSVDNRIAVTKRNSGRGYIYGVEGAVQLALGQAVQVSCSGSWQKGRLKTYPTSSVDLVEEPIDKLMPPAGTLGVRWEPGEKRPWLEILMTGATEQDDLSTADKRDTQRIPPLGTPGYLIYTFRGGVNFTSYMAVSVALENITDRAYRIHGSGQNEPGRNLVVATRLSF
ncbi:hypothetical protein C3F09_12315 [candidate division GN15 bacterium]|uniref:TonB-dependent receptor n=1 Tax=candidate division GN15 bacterium TaxID=2072418 RepID=A0A855X327_9BACT|nr:MAG: hypothetical protein C3F09_12315 [candidate division GN15 bacterium]